MERVDDINLKGFKIKGYRCKCGNEHADINEIDRIVKLLKAFKKGLRATVFKSGNSISVRIPKAVVEVFELKPKKELMIEVQERGIILKSPDLGKT